MFRVLGALALLGIARAAEVTVGTTTAFTTAVANASDGDTIRFTSGTYVLNEPLLFDKALTIVADPGVYFQVSNASSAVFQTSRLIDFKLVNITVRLGPDGVTCSLAEPQPLQANFSIAVSQPSVTSGNVNLNADLGLWYNTRNIRDMHFSTCNFLDNAANNLLDYVWSLDGECHGYAQFKVKFSRLVDCGLTPTIQGTNSIYSGEVRAEYRETITSVREPTERNGSAVVRMSILVNRVDNVVAMAAANYPLAVLEAVITSVNVAVYGTNVSNIVIRVTTPAPYTINSTSALTLVASNLNDISLVPSTLTITTSCNNQAIGDYCVQYISFNLTGCDLSGDYLIPTLDIVCQESAVADSLCPAGTATGSIPFFLATNEFCSEAYCRVPRSTIATAPSSSSVTGTIKDCKSSCDNNNTCRAFVYEFLTGQCTQRLAKTPLSINLNTDVYTQGQCEFNFGTLFSLDLVLRPNSNYTGARGNTSFTLGATSYWTINVWTNVSGVLVDDAIITSVVRTSDGSCSPFNSTAIEALSPSFTASQVQPAGKIDFNIPVTAAVSCASVDRSGNAVNLNFTVTVSYVDDARRRRRHLTMERRAPRTADGTVNGNIATLYTDKDVVAATNSVGKDDTIRNIIIAVVAVLLACSCCSCCAVGTLVLFRLRQKKRSKHEAQAHCAHSYVTSSVEIPVAHDMKAYDVRH